MTRHGLHSLKFRATEFGCMACALLVVGCRGQFDDSYESSTTPAPFFLGPDDDSVAFEIAVCTDGTLDDFYSDAAFFQVEVSATVSASSSTTIDVTLDPGDGSTPTATSDLVHDRLRVELSADFRPTVHVSDRLCSDWGSLSLARTGDSVVRVEWKVDVSVVAQDEISLETYVR